ncbi:hypothetical protein [Halorubrum sp. N11]|uniref:hypothetical protein n=1 Tax=Halorubrum sp. N11 TaxID=3402276 RepID=UPI003EBF009C
MTDENTETHSEDDDREESPPDLRQRVKQYALAAFAWLRAQLAQSVEEIAPQLRGAVSGVSIPKRALKPLAVAGVLLVGAIALGPAAPFDGGDTNIETQEPVEGETYEPVTDETEESVADTPSLDGSNLNTLPSSYLGASKAEAPDPPQEIRASAGSQTMNVETAVVDGEPAIVLEDDRTHDGRWVSIETSWLEENVGEVPNAAFINHEEHGEYAAPLQVRGDSAAFYVKEFSTNTVTFDGEVTLSGVEAGDGTEYQYDLSSTEDVEDPSINLTGVENTASESTNARLTDGESLSVNVGGADSPRDETITLTGIRETTSRSKSYTSTSGTSETVSVGGNTAPESESITVTGKRETTSRSKLYSRVSSTSDSINVGGNVDPTATVSVDRIDSDASFSISENGERVVAYIPDAVGTFKAEGGNILMTPVDTEDYSSVNVDMYITDGDAGTNVFGGTKLDSSTSGDTLSGNHDEFSFNGQYDISGSNGVTIGWEFEDSLIDLDYAYKEGPVNSGDRGYYYQTSVDHTISSGSDSFSTTSNTGEYDLDLSTGSETIDVSGSESVNVDVSWTEVTETRDLSLSQGGTEVWSHAGTLGDGETVSQSLDLSQESSELAFSTAGNADVDLSWTEVTETQDPTVTVGGSTVSHTGTLGDGETVTESVTLSTGSQSADVSVNGPVDVSAEWTEVTKTRDPAVEVNGETVGHSETLADGETVSLDANASWLQEGTNRVNVSTNSPTSGPASLVGLEYSHGAETTTSATVEETTWSQTTNVSNTWPSARSNATATLPMNDRVVDVRNVEVRYNGTTWEPVAESEYALNGTDLSVQLGDVGEGSTTEVRATGSKVRVEDGAITVLEPTTSSDTLNTRLQVDDAGPDFAVSVDSTVFSDRVHYAENATWGETTGDTTITAEGGQRLAMPNATAGAEATVRTWPIEVAVAQDELTVGELAGDRSEPGLAVEGDGKAAVDYTFVDAADATPYILYSETNAIVRDEGLASSPITLTDDNSEETLIFQVDDGSASGSGSGSNAGGGGPGIMDPAGGGSVLGQLQGLVPDSRILVIGVALLGGLAVVGRRTGVITESRTDAATSAASSAAGTIGGLIERILANEIVFGVLILGGAAGLLMSGILSEQATLIVALGAVPVALFLVLQQFDAFDFRIWVGSTALVGVLGIQVLAPQLGETLVEETGVILVVGVLALGWRALSAWRAEANTPDNVTNLEVTAEEDDDA